MAWLKKLLGKDQEERFDPGEEPSRFEPRYLQTGSQDSTQNSNRINPKPSGKKGFDPYNSGAFKRDDAWTRVTRK